MSTIELRPRLSHVLLICGKAAVLENAALLQELSLRCQQPGAMHWLQYFLSTPDFRYKKPYLALLTDAQRRPGDLNIDNVHAAVLFFEYRLLGLPTRIFSTDDSSGFRTVISPVEDRQAASIRAVEALMEAGAQIVLTSRDDGGRPLGPPRLHGRRPVLWARRQRPVARTLLLEPTYEATLKKLGKSTRFNLGYYRRRLLAKMPCEFVPDARGLLSDRELLQVNASSLNPVSRELMKLQYASACNLAGGFLIGLRGPAGEWLSLIGGWRQGGNTVLHWQTNASGYERFSLGTVMRSYFLESEITRGTRTLTFYGGTPHSMQHSFVQEKATDLVVRRSGWRGALLVLLARIAGAIQRRLHHTNFLVEILHDRTLQWRPPYNESRALQQQEANGRAIPGPERVQQTAAQPSD